MSVEPEPTRDPSGADALTPYEASLDRRKPGMLGRLREAREEVRVGLEALADGTASITPRMGLDFITRDTGVQDAVQGSDNAGWGHLDQVPGASDAIALGVGQLAADRGVTFQVGEERLVGLEASRGFNDAMIRATAQLRDEMGIGVSSGAGQARTKPPTWGEMEEVSELNDEMAAATAEPGSVDSDIERAREFGAVYADLKKYFERQMWPSHESVDYALGDGAELSLLDDIADIDGIDELLERTDIQVPIGKFHVPDSGFVRLSDTDQERIIRFGISFEGESEGQPFENIGIEVDLAETDGTVGIYESHTSPDGTPQEKEERLKTEKVLLSPDQMRKVAQILDKYSPSGTITRRATRRARAEGVIDPNQAVVIITTERVSDEMVGDPVLDVANAEVDAGQAHHSINDRPDSA